MSDEHLATAVDALLDDLVGSGQEVGVQVAVVRNGRTLVDTARGASEPRTGAPVDRDTLFWAGSTAKGVASSVAHVLVERGELTDDMRVVDVWPEFGARGKDAVTLRHVLLHTAGVPGLPPGTTAADLCDWDAMCARIADAELWWDPGTRIGYHAKTFGFLLGETLRRATGDGRHDLDAATRASHRSARRRRRGPLRCPRAAVAKGCHAGPRRPPAIPRARARLAARPGDAGRSGPRRRLREPSRPPHLRHPVGGHDERSRRRPHLRGAARPRRRHRARVARPASGDGDGGLLRHRPGDGFPTSWAYGYSPSRPSGRSKPGSAFGMVGMNGSAAYADIDSGIAVAVMRNRFTPGDFTTVERIDRLLEDELS